jgi:hypothetical protein
MEAAEKIKARHIADFALVLLFISKSPKCKLTSRTRPFFIVGRLGLKLEEIAGWMGKTTTASGERENPNQLRVGSFSVPRAEVLTVTEMTTWGYKNFRDPVC